MNLGKILQSLENLAPEQYHEHRAYYKSSQSVNVSSITVGLHTANDSTVCLIIIIIIIIM